MADADVVRLAEESHEVRNEPGRRRTSSGPVLDGHDHEEAAARGLDAALLLQATQRRIDGYRTAASELSQVAVRERVATRAL